MRRLVALAAIASIAFSSPALARAENVSPRGDDGYVFRDAPIQRGRVVMELHRVDSRKTLIALAKELNADPKFVERYQAFSLLDKRQDPPVCHVFIVDPAKHWMPGFLGHETAHCFYDMWHP